MWPQSPTLFACCHSLTPSERTVGSNNPVLISVRDVGCEINHTFPSFFPLAAACARTSGHLGPRGMRVWGCWNLKRFPKKESLRWQAGDGCFSRERLGGFLMHEKGKSINKHLLKNKIIYSLIRKAAFSKHGWQHEGIEHLCGACLQTKENI